MLALAPVREVLARLDEQVFDEQIVLDGWQKKTGALMVA